MAVFAPLFATGIYHRRKPELRRPICYRSLGRMPFLGQPRKLLLLHLISVAPILLAMAHDWWRQRRVHPIYVFGLALFLLSGPVTRGVARASETWRTVSGWLVRWVASQH